MKMKNLHLALVVSWIITSASTCRRVEPCPDGFGGIDCETFEKDTGDYYLGGVIFYIDNTGRHGLIAAADDNGTNGIWGCQGVPIPGARNQNITAGQSNTNAIVTACTDFSAARVCTDLVLNGQSDWYLPSLDELQLLFQHKEIVGNIFPEVYWSSSENDPTTAYLVNMETGAEVQGPKSIGHRFRAIRSF